MSWLDWVGAVVGIVLVSASGLWVVAGAVVWLVRHRRARRADLAAAVAAVKRRRDARIAADDAADDVAAGESRPDPCGPR